MHLRPEGPTHPPVCRPAGPQIPYVRIPVAHATGIGFVGPPGLKKRNFNTRKRGIGALQRHPSLSFRVVISPQLYKQDVISGLFLRSRCDCFFKLCRSHLQF